MSGYVSKVRLTVCDKMCVGSKVKVHDRIRVRGVITDGVCQDVCWRSDCRYKGYMRGYGYL